MASIKDLEKQLKQVKKSFAQLAAAQESNESSDEEQSHFQISKFSFLQVYDNMGRCSNSLLIVRINFLWRKILMDNQSTVNLFFYPNLVTNIRNFNG